MDGKYRTSTILKRIWAIVHPYRQNVYYGVLLAFLISALSIVSGYTLRMLVDFILPEKMMKLLWPIQLVFLSAVLAESALTLWQTRLFSTAATRGQMDLRNQLFYKLIHLDYLTLQELRAADIITSLNQRVDALYGVLCNGIPVAISYAIDIIITLAVMAMIDWRLMLISLPIYPLLLIINHGIQKRVTKKQRQYQTAYASATNDVTEAIRCQGNIRTYCLEAYMTDRYRINTGKMQKSEVQCNILFELMQRVGWAMVMVPYQAILYGIGGAWLMSSGNPSIGTLLIFANFTNHLLNPVMGLININNDIASARAAYEALDQYAVLKDREQLEEISLDEPYDASIKNLCYGYPAQERAVLQNLSIDIRTHDTLVLWGNSGSGKSTLLKLLFGFLSAPSGEMLQRNTRKTWGYLPQKPVLLSISILENFRLAAPGIQEEEIWRFLRMSSMDTVVRKKPEGLHCLINESENLFSGGEYRRLCLAVFLAANADVMLFDEPTAELDENSASIIADTLRELKTQGGKTMVIATHDRKLKLLADHVLALDGDT